MPLPPSPPTPPRPVTGESSLGGHETRHRGARHCGKQWGGRSRSWGCRGPRLPPPAALAGQLASAASSRLASGVCRRLHHAAPLTPINASVGPGCPSGPQQGLEAPVAQPSRASAEKQSPWVGAPLGPRGQAGPRPPADTPGMGAKAGRCTVEQAGLRLRHHVLYGSLSPRLYNAGDRRTLPAPQAACEVDSEMRASRDD